MRSNSDFWLTLHKVVDDLAKEGATDDERAANVCKVLSALPRPAQEFYLSNLEFAKSALAEIVRKCKSSAND